MLNKESIDAFIQTKNNNQHIIHIHPTCMPKTPKTYKPGNTPYSDVSYQL